MNLPSVEECRSKVDELLKKCVDEKLLYGGTARAISIANQAFDLATVNHLPSPWPEFAAYRLAHLRMRSGSNDLKTLQEIDSLFELASRFEKTGPIPLIYRLAVLHRLAQSLIDKDDIDHLVAKSIEVYEKAIGLLRRMQYVPEITKSDRIERQSALFNLLELAAYMSGRAYQSLEGISFSSAMDLFRKGDWFVVGRGIDQISMTESMARLEFEDRANKNPELILIELSSDDGARICHSKNREWNVLNQAQAKLILILLQNPDIPKVDLERKVVGTDGENPSTKFRKVKSRVKEVFERLTGNELISLFIGNSNQLTDEIPILGLVHGPSFRNSENSVT